MQYKNTVKIILALLIATIIASFFIFDLGQYFSLSYIKEQQNIFKEFYYNNRIITIGIYMLVYIVMAAFSLPGAAVMTLLGGGLFGLGIGLVAVSFASTIGATLAFITSRFLVGDMVQKKYGDKLEKINKGIETEGAYYLFALRLVPAFPFFMINLLMGLTRVKILTFFIVSQIGMLPGTAVYVYVGTQIAQIESLSGIMSPALLLGFLALGLFPLVVKKLMGLRRKDEQA